MSGKLYIVSTPIGNLDDITLRAIEVLKSVDLIACEDTRRTMILLEKFGIAKKLISYYNYNERQRAEELISYLKSGKNIALVSDSGTPGISDPGYALIRRAIEENIQVIPIPGATAFVCALVVSGLPMDEFVFVGFLPHKKGRKTKLQKLAQEERTVILYESPHRVLKTLNEILENFGDREIAVAKELTKIHEEIFRGKISEVLKKLTPDKIKGEFVIVISGKTN
ncbi:16S rRNA (cytidine(1402)-2'-O)-methyltransferase [Candidatus Kryptobacter tengchongensis]|uniref:Ribosomal RNA small subunit methyltransferase I n=1 Tax=Kryptobacter tengchongensis TaxID=1643429 RepID=A0A916LIU9_KRYT1|nr:16S rRNA (cytidine(1402)-2'-O)-methyltransferase [Candidatus Kryptobacter tengchongensis]CUS98502.1 16S rRNA (cytidine1402-2'-O)-methyltransferase [Candidatus Kryptobacter tengchongensis]